MTHMSQGSSSDPSAPRFSVGEPETAISHERMKELDIRGIDGSLYALNAKGQWKWFGTNLVRIVYAEGPRDNPFESIVAKSELSGLPDAYTDTRYGFAEDHRWGDGPTLANVYFDPDSGHILGFMHTEWTLESKDGTYFRLGMAISRDGGRSFQWCGHMIEPELSYDTWSNHWRGGKVGGHHAMANVGLANYVIKDGYFYLYYADVKDRPDAFIQGTAVARAKVSDVVAAADKLETAPWHKYYDGGWNESGHNGKFTALNIEPKGYLHGDAAYNSHLDKFVLVTRHGKHTGPDGSRLKTGEILISFSGDGIDWSEWQTVHADCHLHDYPSIVSMGDDNEVLGKSFWVYYKYCFNNVLPDWDWYTNRWDRVLVTMD
jgi:hypothetical protein